jgi:hypothetical protein
MAKKKAAVKKEKKLSMKEKLERLETCNAKRETLKKWYKRRDELIKEILPTVFEKGKDTNEDIEEVTLKVGKKSIVVSPSYFDKKGEFKVTGYKATSVPLWNIEIK